jgi:hypothetical protein
MPVMDSQAYQAAYGEAVARVVVRDTILLGYVAASGAILASQFAKDFVPAIPLLSLFAACMMAHHDSTISRLNGYLQEFEGDNGRTLWHNRPDKLAKVIWTAVWLYAIPATLAFGGYSTYAIWKIYKSDSCPNLYWITLDIAASFAALVVLWVGRYFQLRVKPPGASAT